MDQAPYVLNILCPQSTVTWVILIQLQLLSLIVLDFTQNSFPNELPNLFIESYIYIYIERERDTHTHTHTHIGQQNFRIEKQFIQGCFFLLLLGITHLFPHNELVHLPYIAVATNTRVD